VSPTAASGQITVTPFAANRNKGRGADDVARASRFGATDVSGVRGVGVTRDGGGVVVGGSSGVSKAGGVAVVTSDGATGASVSSGALTSSPESLSTTGGPPPVLADTASQTTKTVASTSEDTTTSPRHPQRIFRISNLPRLVESPQTQELNPERIFRRKIIRFTGNIP